ncbi:MAG TPA: hypothetical protein VFA30_08895 [Gaiellaceae bacterium]|nr:hypothetical protein [Gaiellaceae bacterium]
MRASRRSRSTGARLAALVVLALVFGPPARAASRCTVAQLSRPLAAADLRGVVHAGAVSPRSAASRLETTWLMRSARHAVEISVVGPDVADGVLFFVYANASAARTAVNLQQLGFAHAHAGARVGRVRGAAGSIVWTAKGADAGGIANVVVVAAIPSGRIVVEGVAANGESQPSPNTASVVALVRWGVARLARVCSG